MAREVITTLYRWSENLRENRESPAFYTVAPDPDWYSETDSHNHMMVAKVSKEDRTIFVYRDGKMLIHLYDEPEDRHAGYEPTIIRDGDKLRAMGVTDDETLARLEDEDRLIWVMNPWFDLYAVYADGRERHLDRVAESLGEAVEVAQSLLDEPTVWGVDTH